MKKTIDLSKQKLSDSAKIESLLFTAGKPITIPRLSQLIDASTVKVKQILEELQKELEATNRGIAVVIANNKVEMVANPKYSKTIARMTSFEIEEKLSDAALETLSIIAYRGPITGPEIEIIRGVNSQYLLRQLVTRGLVLKNENEGDSRTSLFEVSPQFLKHMGITNVESLPDYSSLSIETSFEEYLKQKEEKAQAHIKTPKVNEAQ